MARFVVIYHTGKHDPLPERLADPVKRIPWTTGKHQRKFMQMSGLATNYPHIQPSLRDELYFWGEYEPATDATRLTVPSHLVQPANAYPSRLDRPVIPIPPRPNGPQNTDPFVFCGPFISSNCMQTAKFQQLQTGDVLLFGSRQLDNSQNYQFVLDTCIVINTAISLINYPRASHSLFDYITGDLIRTLPTAATFTVFHGASWRPQDPFSFVPAWDRLDNGNCSGYPKPIIDPTKTKTLIGAITPNQRQGIKGINVNRTLNEVMDMWNEVVRQVQVQGCLLATEIHHPMCHIPQTQVTNAGMNISNSSCGPGSPTPKNRKNDAGRAPDVIGGSC